MATCSPNPKKHVDEIRRKKFSIGGEPNPLTEDLHQAVRNLSAELYTKDVHFFMELIQNAEDNEYSDGVDPSLEFVITSRDITATGAPATLLMFNNEKGFSPKNIESICSVGRSTKKGNRKRGYIGEKGIGFKSVFLITAQPYIFSNGYQIRFDEGPCPHCDLGYIVPEWIEGNQILSDVKKIYGPSPTLPTTTIVLPLKADKVEAVKQQLSSVHPEILLFLLKIKRLSVREDNKDSSQNTVNAIAITSETDVVARKNIDAESYTLYLAAEENGGSDGRECGYYMWKQKFPVRPECRVERRTEVDYWNITLAFPFDERLNRGMTSPGVYAFLPTEMVTNFPFIVQADFLLSSSRETILLDDRWNQGILDCVPVAFINAFVSLVKVTDNAPVSSLVRMFKFIPLNNSSYQKFNVIRDSIRAKLMEEDIIPSETVMEQKFFHKPCEVARIMPAFRDILEKARKEKVSLHNISSHGCYILHSSFDMSEYDSILSFLGIGFVESEWYSKCIRSTNLVLGVPENVYVELLHFLVNHWCSKFHGSDIKSTPLIKYVDLRGHVSLCSISEAAQCNSNMILYLSRDSTSTTWLIDWNKEFRCEADHFFMPSSTRNAIVSFSKKKDVLEWLQQHVKVKVIDVGDYATVLKDHLNSDRKLAVMYPHFLYHSLSKRFLSAGEVSNLCGSMPLVNSYGYVETKSNQVLVPADGSKWAHLTDTNLWSNGSFIVLAEDYLQPATFAGTHTPGRELLDFLKTYVGASDLPNICAPDIGLPAVNAPLTKENTFLLLDWIRNLMYNGVQIPRNFLASLKEGCWLRVTVNGSSGYRPPSNSFFPSSSWGSLLQNGSVLVDIPLVDKSFYGDKIDGYKEEMKRIGVVFEFGDACEYVGKHLMSRAASSTLTGDQVISILKFIRYLREKFLPPEHFIKRINGVRWLRTSFGEKSPTGAVLFDKEWKFASQISDIPFIDHTYYGNEIFHFKEELKLLGVIVGFNGNHQVVVDHLKSPSCLTGLKPEALLLALSCMFNPPSSGKSVEALQDAKCIKTNLGYKSPGECFLPDPQWGCLLQIFRGFAIIDSDHYGINIFLYKNELKILGVMMDSDTAFTQFCHSFKKQASLSSITKENVFSFLSCYRKLKGTSIKFPDELKRCIREEKWLRTKLGDFRSPRDCILYGQEWEAIFPITTLPFIDDTDKFYGNGIHDYKDELKHMGVVIELEKGVKHVVSGLCLPNDTARITPANVLSLLQCVRIFLKGGTRSLSETFFKKISGKWLQTTVGYRSPDECLLFDDKFKLKQMDGPFIDDSFYGSSFSSYKKELTALGVSTVMGKWCRLLSDHLYFHSDFETIRRVYDFFQEVGWKPESEAVPAPKLWIPLGCDSGLWANPEDCVLHDKDGLFGMHLNVLESHYDVKLLSFFSSAFGVRSNPSFEDFSKLWKTWEESGQLLSQANCCAFWRFVVRSRSPVKVKELGDNLLKLPVDSNSEEVLLSDKGDVYIADDLELKDLFDQSASHPIFVWYPQKSSPLLRRNDLLDLYRRLGVRTISESVQKEEVSLSNGQEFNQVNGQDFWIRKGLVRIILAFLAGRAVKLEVEERQETVKSLLNITVLETKEPISVVYSLTLSSGEILHVQGTRYMRWDRKNSKLFTHKLDRTSGEKDRLEYATYFSQVIAEGILWQNEDQIGSLSELIKLGFLVEFNEEAVSFLMKSKNLQVFKEDDEFLSAVFTSE